MKTTYRLTYLARYTDDTYHELVETYDNEDEAKSIARMIQDCANNIREQVGVRHIRKTHDQSGYVYEFVGLVKVQGNHTEEVTVQSFKRMTLTNELREALESEIVARLG